jgi:hypothetical protein
MATIASWLTRGNCNPDFSVETSVWSDKVSLHCKGARGIRVGFLPVVGGRRGKSLTESIVTEIQLSKYRGAIGIAGGSDVDGKIDLLQSLRVAIAKCVSEFD